MEIIPLQGKKVVTQCSGYYNVNGLKKVKRKKKEKMTNNYTLQPPVPPYLRIIIYWISFINNVEIIMFTININELRLISDLEF